MSPGRTPPVRRAVPATAKDNFTEIIACTDNYKADVSSWWTVVCLRSCLFEVPAVDVWYRSPNNGSFLQAELGP